tara:strand:- start:3147 stop:3542 length:396 start_codon:yes stop_codon:yes gene_type:complete
MMNELFAAVYTRLNVQLTVNVYDHVPQDLSAANYPFVRIDAIQTSNNDTDSENGFTATMQVVGFSHYRGVKEINTIADSVYNALQHWSFPDTATYGISGIQETFRTIAVQPDGLTRNSVQQYQIIFEPLPL